MNSINKEWKHIFLLGPGRVGSTLLQQIDEHQKCAKKHLPNIHVAAICNSRKMYFENDGFSYDSWKKKLERRGCKTDFGSFLDTMKKQRLPHSIFVDCTASEVAIPHYGNILRSGISIVTPNKKAMSGPFSSYKKLKRLSNPLRASFLYETNVGAGLPLISTLNDLCKSGDTILKIEGILSGTLSYFFNTFTEELPFSEVVKDAMSKGFTEPDPRDDLSGLDVAKKILILARETGSSMEMEDVQVEDLIPVSCKKAKSIDDFLVELEKENQYFEEKRQHAAADGKVLRYIAVFEDGKARVGIREIDKNHPFYQLSGNDNVVSFTTARYKDNPLVVKGPGAGLSVTAAGVLGDILRIVS